MKNILTVIIVLLVLAVITLFIYIKIFSSRIAFVFDIKNISFADFNLSGLLTQGQSQFSVEVQSTIKNNNSFSVKIKNPCVQIYYNNQLIAVSDEKIRDYIQSVNVLSNSVTSFSEHLAVIVNSNTIDLIAKLKQGQKINLNYKVKINIFGIYFLISDTTTY